MKIIVDICNVFAVVENIILSGSVMDDNHSFFFII